MSFETQLVKLEACSEAVDWVGYKTLEQAWAKCGRGDWMLWLAAKLEIDRKLIVQAACDCAELALVYVPDGEDRPARAIATARAWCEGEATLGQAKAAAYAAYAAAYADAADAAAANAADAAVGERKQSLAKSADLVRGRISVELVADALEDQGE